MIVGWRTYLRVNAPAIFFWSIVAFAFLAGVYALGHSHGKEDIIDAAFVAGKEAR